MKPYLSSLAACLVLLSSALLVPDVYAQFGGGGMGGAMGGGRHGAGDRPKGCDSGDKPDPAKGHAGPQAPMGREQLEYHLGALQADLRLSPEQSVAWQGFSDRVLALQADMERQRNRQTSALAAGTGASASGIKPIALAVDATRNRLTALEDIEAAGRSLYQTLQPDQRTLADLRMASFVAPLLRG